MSSRPSAASSTPWSASGEAPSGSRCPTRRWPEILRRALRATADGTLAITLAPACPVCREPLRAPTLGAVCPACWSAVVRYPERAAAEAECPPVLDAWAAAGPFEGTLREIVHAFKYEGRWSLARPLARLMRAAGGPLLDACDIVVPVPLHPSRRRARGFDQAEALARGLGRPVVAALARRTRTLPQASLPLEARRRNVAGAFTLAGRELVVGWRSYRAGVAVGRLRGASILLVDDVATSASTLEACASVLREAGASRVTALTVARALPPPRR